MKKGTFFLDKVGSPQGKRQYEEQKTPPSLPMGNEGVKVLKKGLVSSDHVVYGLGEFCVHFLCLILHEIQKFESLFFCVQLKYVLTFFLIEG